ncbi:6-phosphogluconolactonase [Bordetella sp. FB-8]|uniref:6-phosphogluconolactonase n=1 Tax=Bordetella sp. FB-8 TaxID=1159870 RepID=UPI00035F16B3|nr:6-phosphogluconolactonase [Bordetella sp. FB-8]
MKRFECPDNAAQVAALVQAVRQPLAAALDADGSAVLAVSGGRSPVPLFHALRNADLDWSRVWITLVDERCVAPDHTDSNERLVREHLLAGQAAAACFAGLVRDPADILGSLTAANGAARPITVALLGMGEDGHTASLFPGAPELAAGLDPNCPARYIAVTPPAAPYARISLNLSALLQARRLVLAIAGQAKRRVFDAACAAFSPDLPISALIHQTQAPLDVYWTP